MELKKIVAASVVVFTLSGCAADGSGGLNKQNIGTLLGGAGGAVIGSQFGKGKGQLVGVAAGTLLGAALGNSIGASLDRADMNYYHQSSQYSLENAKTGTTASWSNPDNGHSGTVTPTRTYQTSSGTNCREYTQTITIDGRTERGYGTACRQADGSWQITQ